jgi:flagellar motor component MotA
MDQDVALAISISIALVGCIVGVLIGNYVCPRRQLQQLEEDDFV